VVARLRLAILAVSVSAISKAALRRRSLTLGPGTAVALGVRLATRPLRSLWV
jgi:hypothetical protein